MLFLCQYSLATMKIAVIDTGFDFNGKWSIQPKLCATGHKDFTGTGLQDSHGHGTHVAGLIASYSREADYCLIILKFFDPREIKADTLKSSSKALEYAISQKVDIINYSAGGTAFDYAEAKAVKNALNAGITVVAAAGNEYSHLDKKAYYPALYDARVVVVGAVTETLARLPASNYGPQVDVFENGSNVVSLAPNSSYVRMSGTSMATAIHTGKIVNKVYRIKKLYNVVSPKYLKRQVPTLA